MRSQLLVWLALAAAGLLGAVGADCWDDYTPGGLNLCDLPCGEFALEDGAVWNFTTDYYPSAQPAPFNDWCLCQWF